MLDGSPRALKCFSDGKVRNKFWNVQEKRQEIHFPACKMCDFIMK